MNVTPLHQALLDLGSEDFIPLCETTTPGLAEFEHRDVPEPERDTASIAGALKELLWDGRIQVFIGPWPEEPTPVGIDRAHHLVGDSRRYSAASTDDGPVEVVYYVTVEKPGP